jgi:hypothetical protein
MLASPADNPAMGDLGPSWSSAMGGGLGKRGLMDGDRAMAMAICMGESASESSAKVTAIEVGDGSTQVDNK